jgi:hypothetical protein
MSFQSLTTLFVFVTLCGCSTQPKQPEPITPIKFENKEKDKYIEKVEAVVSDSASALTAVVPSLDKGTVRELVEAQVTRLSGVAKPSVAKVEEFTRIIKQNDTKAVEKDKAKAEKVNDETEALYEMVMLRDIELQDANSRAEKAVARADMEFKQKELWRYSTVGLGMFVAGVLAIAFTPFKKEGFVVILGGMLAMASAWIFESAWFDWIAGGSIALISISIIVWVISLLRKKNHPLHPTEPSQEI